MYTGRQTDRQTPTHQHRHTDNDEYSIVAVDKPQLLLFYKGRLNIINTVKLEMFVDINVCEFVILKVFALLSLRF